MLSNVKTAVVALGGNAISRKDMPDTIANQFRLTRESLSAILPLIKADYNIAITHGNGPQVGNAILRVELARDRTPVLPIGICVAGSARARIARVNRARAARAGVGAVAGHVVVARLRVVHCDAAAGAIADVVGARVRIELAR